MIGTWLDWITQQWVKTTGRRVGPEAWLAGAVGSGYIGERWLDRASRVSVIPPRIS